MAVMEPQESQTEAPSETVDRACQDQTRYCSEVPGTVITGKTIVGTHRQ